MDILGWLLAGIIAYGAAVLSVIYLFRSEDYSGELALLSLLVLGGMGLIDLLIARKKGISGYWGHWLLGIILLAISAVLIMAEYHWVLTLLSILGSFIFLQVPIWRRYPSKKAKQ